MPSLNLKTKQTGSNQYFPGNFILSEVGSMQMEFCTLSKHTGDNKFCEAALKCLSKLEKLQLGNKHYKSLISYSGNPHNKITLGGLADSFYEVSWNSVNS